MENEKRKCNQICHWNDSSDGCVIPKGRICPMANTKPDASGCGQARANEKRLIDANEALRMIENSRTDNPYFNGKTTPIWEKAHDCALSCVIACPTVDAVVLPCKIGDYLWCVYSPPRPANPADKGKWYMGEFEVARFHYGVKGLSIEMYGFGAVAVKEIGKTVFLSREEAEAALAKMDGGNEDG